MILLLDGEGNPLPGRCADSGADGGAAALRGAVLSFDAKESTKESQRHGDYGKKALIAHFDGGARNVARNGVGWRSPAFGARSCSPFSAVKMGGPFSLRCQSPLCSSAGGARRTKPMQVAMSWHRLDGFAEQKNRLVFLLWLALSIRKQRRLGYFNNWIPATQKASWISYPRWPLLRAMRPVAEWRSLLFN